LHHVGSLYICAHMYVVLSKAEKHVSYEELVSTTECMTL